MMSLVVVVGAIWRLKLAVVGSHSALPVGGRYSKEHAQQRLALFVKYFPSDSFSVYPLVCTGSGCCLSSQWHWWQHPFFLSLLWLVKHLRYKTLQSLITKTSKHLLVILSGSLVFSLKRFLDFQYYNLNSKGSWTHDRVVESWKFQKKRMLLGREGTSLYFRVNLRSKDKLSFRDNNNIYLCWYSSQWYQPAKNVYSFFAKTVRNETPRKNNDLKSEPESFSPKSTFGLEKKPFYLNPDHSCSRTFSDWDLENLAMK